MKKPALSLCIIILLMSGGCYEIYNKRHSKKVSINDSTINKVQINLKDTTLPPSSLSLKTDSSIVPIKDSIPNMIQTGNISADSVISFAKSLIGITYKYGSTDPKVGFDCSGFFTFVFNHFNIKVPRSSREFEFSGINVPLLQATKGDILLFTGTDSTERFIGHMGLILSNDKGNINFIHSSSGKAYGVTISPLDKYYMGRFLKIIRIFRKP